MLPDILRSNGLDLPDFFRHYETLNFYAALFFEFNFFQFSKKSSAFCVLECNITLHSLATLFEKKNLKVRHTFMYKELFFNLFEE